MQLTNTQQLSACLDRPQRTIQYWAQIGKLPTPLPLKRRTVWLTDTILDWILVNAPDADLSALEGVPA